MNELAGALRALHYTFAILLLGELVSRLAVATPAFRRTSAVRDGEVFERRSSAVAGWTLAAGMASGAAWFVVQAAVMSGLQMAAMTRETLAVVLGSTQFGLVFGVRTALAVALAAVLVAGRRSRDSARRSGVTSAAVALAAGYLGSLAWTGHAVTGAESGDRVRFSADAAHLIAAGAWLGALPALVFVLGRTRSPDAAAEAARRFSRLGLASVGVLTMSGLVNAWYQVGGIPALFGTGYGRLLLAKLALFAAMLVLATLNRAIATRPPGGSHQASLRQLRRNARLEIALGLAVMALVGALGITVPAIHQPVVWPFEHTLSLEPIQQSAWLQVVVAAAAALVSIAAVALVAGALGRPPRVSIAAVAGLALPGALLACVLAVPAHPTTYLASPVGYTADAIAAGSSLYAMHCSSCHGRGDGPVRAASADAPGGLSDRVPNRRAGDLFWAIAQGVPGTPMPGFASRASDAEIWSLVQFLDAQTAAQHALAMGDRIRPLRPVPAPDFAYQLTGGAQEMLAQPAGSRVTLLVFYTLPSSLPRLLELATHERTYSQAGARVIALPMPASPAATALEPAGAGEPILATAGPAVALTYLMFARQRQGDGGTPVHLEYLIDRFNYLRVRRLGLPPELAGPADETLRQIDALVQEPPRPQAQWGHRH